MRMFLADADINWRVRVPRKIPHKSEEGWQPVNSGPMEEIRSRNEIADAMAGFTPAQWGRLRKAAAYHASDKPVSWPDLLQMALESALDGRNCPISVDVVQFLVGAMRSIADGELDKASRRIILVPVPKTGGNDLDAVDVEFADEHPSAEDQLIEAESYAAKRAVVLALFDDDHVTRDLVEGIMAGMSVADIRELTGLSQTAYDSKRRLIRRRIDIAFPKGSKP